MADLIQYDSAPAPSKTEFEALSEQVTSLNSNLTDTNERQKTVNYNANTDRNVESNRTTVMDWLIENYFSYHRHFAIVRYSSGYYHGYIFIGSYDIKTTMIVEITHDVSGKVIFWRKDQNGYTKDAVIS